MRVVGAALGALVALTPLAAGASCPSYTPAETAGGYNCGVDPAPGTNPSIAEWQIIFGDVAPGKASWGTNGPDIGTFSSGCGKPTPPTQVAAHFPCHVLYAITMVESGWRQFCTPTTPAQSVGDPSQTIVSFDCGYGIGQVTSGMHVGETPSFDRARVASDPEYNLATGTLILASKWKATQCVGDNNPDLVEDWYTSIWAYNGLVYKNNPNNPNLTAGRGVYNPANGGSYAYQEEVFGWMEHPPSDKRWAALAPAYPDRAEIGNGGAPPALSEPSCASPTDCTNTRSTHVSVCTGATDGGASDAGGVADGATDGGTDGGSPQGAADASSATGETGGCSCRAAPTGRGAAWWAIAIGVVVLRRRRRDLVLATTTSALIPGCALMTDLDGLRSETVTDAGDAAQLNDSPSDVSDAHYCATIDATFCDDFDESKPLGSGWSNVNVGAGCTLAVVSDASTSPSSSLSAWAGPDASFPTTLTYTQTAATSTSIAVEADVRLDRYSGPTSNALTALEIGLNATGTPQWRARLDVYPNHVDLEDFQWLADGGANFQFTGLTQFLSVGQWTHVRIEVDLVAKQISVLFDGVPVLDKHPTPHLWSAGFTPMMNVGIVESVWGFVGPWGFHVDNVVFYGR